jgi:hypothetical protein
MQTMNDPTRLAAAVLLEELSSLAGQLAQRLRSDAPLPAILIGRLLIDANKAATRFGRHSACLNPPADALPRTPYG